MTRLNCLIIFILFFIISKHCSGQSYGLAFNGNEEVQDKRTSLDLSPSNYICLEKDFDLSFDLSFISGHSNYFGYIFRIIEDSGRNIDLVYDRRFEENKHIKLIVGEAVSNIAFDINLPSMLKDWHHIKLSFLKSKRLFVLTVDKKNYVQKINFTPRSCIKILFGANNYKEFRTTDLPPMKVKNIRLTEGKTLKHHWPLTAQRDSIAEDLVGGKDGKVINPLWIKKMHYQWELMEKFSLKGAASVAFDKETENLHIVGSDSVFTYSIPLHEFKYIPYSKGRQVLMPGNQAFFESANKQLYNLYIDQKLVSKFNFSDASWEKQYKHPDVITLFWHFNKFYSTLDSSLYILGGYGQFTYYSDVLRYHFPTKEWEKIKPKGNFTPRYLAALGTVDSGAYVLGGYGSLTGQQILNPKNLYDLSFYDTKKNTFNKLFDLEIKGREFAFANSMVVNERDRSYYALAFNNHKYNSALQLIRGSLDSKDYEVTGSEIPYTFHDIHSFADLYYCSQTKKFVAVTLFHDVKTDITRAEIYSLFAPPITAEEHFADKSLVSKKYLLILLVLIVFVALWYLYNKKQQNKKAVSLSKIPVGQENLAPIMVQQVSGNETLFTSNVNEQQQEAKNSIFVFGDMQLFDASGNDITKYFTPLLKELFLVILLYTLRWERGISSEKLTEILWFDKTVESARNNRSVNIAKLKTILEKIDSCTLSKETGYWKLKANLDTVWIDYSHYLRIVGDKQELSKEKIIELAKITERGGFLSNVEYDWLDAFKSEISNDVIDTYLHFASSIKIEDDPEFLISLTNYIFYFDTVNEEAMIIKCKSLVHLGKHSLAKSTFETFNRDYKAIYGEEFGLNFQQILE